MPINVAAEITIERPRVEVAAFVTDPSNDQTWSGVEGQRAPVKHLVGIRRGLLEATGLRVGLGE